MKDKEFLEKYNEILEKFSNVTKKINIKPIYNKKYVKTEKNCTQKNALNVLICQ